MNILVKMYHKSKSNKDMLFGSKEEERDSQSTSLNISDIEKSLDDDFFTVVDKNYPKRKNKEFFLAEKVAAVLTQETTFEPPHMRCGEPLR